MISQNPNINILLAEDDKDDCLLFQEALEELDLQTQLTFVHDGVQLMQLLTKNSNQIFDVLFLDLNMPCKNGYECLEEIKRSDELKSLPIIIFSTSYDQSVADLLLLDFSDVSISAPAQPQSAAAPAVSNPLDVSKIRLSANCF